MSYVDKSIIKLSKCPSVLEMLNPTENIIIIGTYELDEDEQNGHSGGDSNGQSTGHRNNRSGSLCTVKNDQIIIQFECPDGGVFDLKVTGPQEVIVAHSNGFLCLYNLSIDGQEIFCLSKFDTSYSLLTSLDTFYSNRTHNRIISAADSSGSLCITSFDDKSVQFEKISELQVGHDPIWCLKLLNLLNNHFLIFTGSDDCCLNVYSSSSIPKDHQEAKPLLSNAEASGGITAIDINIKSAADSFEMEAEVFVGSYDEHIRVYDLRCFTCHESDVDLANCIKMTLRTKLEIPRSGIWKIRFMKQVNMILVAGMFSGAHLIQLNPVGQPNQEHLTIKQSISYEDSGSAEKKQLIYDMIPSLNMSTLFIASFYQRTIHVLNRNKPNDDSNMNNLSR